MKKRLFIVGIFIANFLGVALAQDTASSPGTVIDSGDVRRDYGFYSLVFYFTPEPTLPVEETARKLIKDHFSDISVVTSSEEGPKPPFIGLLIERAPLKDYPVPDENYFKYAGRGLSPSDIKNIQKTNLAFRLILIAPKEGIWKNSRRFTEFGLVFAEKTGAFIWDSATRECFSPKVWKEKRLDSWTETIPNMPDQFTVHAYRVAETNYVRTITLGMEKFALPDLVIQQVVASETRFAGNMINATAQMLAEDPVVTKTDSFELSLTGVKNESVRTMLREYLLPKAAEKARLALITGKPEEGDPQNTLIELDFRNGVGRSNDERRNSVFTQIWGAASEVTNVRHDDAILAASQKAKSKLPEIQRRFAKGLAPGEQILLKAPFARDDEGSEWMWVEVLQWPEKGKIIGILQNDPYYIKKLRAGSRVVIKPEEVFDYIHYKADGSEEGNETSRLIQLKAEAK